MNYKILNTSFLGKPIDKNKSYTIIGAGFSGLILGHYFKKTNLKFKIVEKSSQPGGLLQSVQTDFGLVEKAANGFIWSKEIQSLCDDLKLEILSPRQDAKARYIVKNGQLRKIPLSFLDGFKLANAFLKKHPQPFNTLQDFGNYFFGKKITHQVVAPAFAGIYGAPLELLSFPGAMTKVAEGFNESNYLRSALKNMKTIGTDEEKKKRSAGTHSFKKGMSELTHRLAEELKSEIEYNIDGVKLKDSVENLILTIPAFEAKHFFDDQMHELLSNVKYSTIISVTTIFNISDFNKFKKGFGCLIPRNDDFSVMGILFNSYIFDHRVVDENHISLTCLMRDNSSNLQLFNQSDDEIKKLVINDLDKLFELKNEPLELVITRWKNGIPIYSPELYNSWFEIDEILKNKLPNRNLFGNYTGEISIRGMAKKSHELYKYL